MAIIVDKEQKKRDIALACKDLLVHSSINDLTIAQIAKTAGIGKGTFYEYFTDKNELVFELVNLLMHEHNQKKEQKLAGIERTRDKIKLFYEFFYSEESADLRALYKEFVAISLIAPQEEMLSFQTECFRFYSQWVEKIIDEGIAKGEILPVSKELIKGMYIIGEGMFIASEATEGVIELQKDINHFVDRIFELVERRESI
ncbi:MAG: TetR/AcrR family transcriptional regulator [Sulfurovum sp.]|nr:MAG: TetR/AcrR family transcriptional regulator [Sulfurovum sp.]